MFIRIYAHMLCIRYIYTVNACVYANTTYRGRERERERIKKAIECARQSKPLKRTKNK
jgi:hypothetical protein